MKITRELGNNNELENDYNCILKEVSDIRMKTENLAPLHSWDYDKEYASEILNLHSSKD